MAIISVIIPVYNVQNYIDIALNSLISQNDQDFEIIVINDGSTDNTVSVIEEIFSKNDFDNYKIINKENGGVSSARNRGILEATGKYIYFLDGDDYVSNDMVSTVKHCIDDGKPDTIAWGFNSVREDKSLISDYFDLYSSELTKMTGMEALKDIIVDKTLWICTSNAVYKKDFIIENEISYTEGCLNGEDQEFTFKSLSRANKVYFINRILSFYVQREGSISNSYNIKRFDVINAINRTVWYIKDNNLVQDDEIVEYLEYNHLIKNYFYNFNSSIEYLFLVRRMTRIEAIDYLMNDIDKTYLGLNEYIKNKIKSIKNVGVKTKIKYKLFLINPILYSSVLTLYIKLKHKKLKN